MFELGRIEGVEPTKFANDVRVRLVDFLVEKDLSGSHRHLQDELVHLPEQVFQFRVELLDDVGGKEFVHRLHLAKGSYRFELLLRLESELVDRERVDTGDEIDHLANACRHGVRCRADYSLAGNLLGGCSV